MALKALFRRAKAHEGRGDADAAQADFKRVAELQPYNVDAQEEARPGPQHCSDACADSHPVCTQLEKYKSVLHRIVVMSYGDADMRRRQQGGL